MSKGFASNYRIVLLSGALLLCFGGISARLVWLHVVYRDEIVETKNEPRRADAGQPRRQPRRELIAEARRQLIVDKSRRGDIYDARGAVLATSRSVLRLGVDPNPLTEKEEQQLQDRLKKDPKTRLKYEEQRKKAEQEGWPQLAALIGLPASEVRRIMTTKFRDVTPDKASSASSASANAVNPAQASRPSLVINLNLPSAANTAGAVATVAAGSGPEAVATDVDEEPAEKSNTPVISLATNAADATNATDDDDDDSEPATNGRRKIRWAVLLPEISESLNDQVKALCAKYGIKNVYATGSYRRVYPHNHLGAHVVGFVNRTEHPASGVERFADFYLRGQDGWREGERDVRGRELPQFNKRSVERVDGYGVTLSLDSIVQNIIERELAVIAEKFDPKKATIIVSDPRTGFILGLANYPTFNLNEFGKTSPESMKNSAVFEDYEPGSVFKIVAASGALDQGLVTRDSTFDCSITKIEYRGFTRSLPSEAHHFDHKVTVAEIIAQSSNRGAAQLAMKLGEQRFFDYAKVFGFGARTGLLGSMDKDMARHGFIEAPGKLRLPTDRDRTAITRMPMGQGVAVTVLQMHQAMSVIANGGQLMEPQLIRNLRDNSGAVVHTFDPIITHRAIAERTARTMSQLLMGCAAKGGTAPEAAIPGYEVAGKTGTTQKYLPLVVNGRTVLLANGRPKNVPSKQHHVSSFVGFFPAGDPQVVISVIVDEADARCPGGAGGKVAAPSFRRIGEQLIPVLNIKAGNGAAPVSLTTLVAQQGVRP